jgi:amino acid transporter
MQAKSEERSVGELFADLSREVTKLFRQEIRLAKTEMTQKATQAGKDVGFLAVGGVLAYTGLLAIVAAIILALALVLPAWLAAFIVGVVIVGIGAFLALRGLGKLKRTELAPRQTVETIQEDATWAKGQMQ